MSKFTRMDLEVELGKLREMVTNMYAEVMMIERLLCEIAEKLQVDKDLLEEVCSHWSVKE